MYSSYYNEHSVFIESAKKIIFQEIAPHIKEWEKNSHFPNQVFEILGQHGLLGILVPEQYGGSGGDYKLAGAGCEVFGELCAVGLTTAVNMHSLVISSAIAKYASDSQKQRWLPSAMQGKSIGAYAFTEPGAGSDLANLRTQAVKKGSSWVINGSKTFITNGARADFVLVLTRTDMAAGYAGFTTFLVDTKLPGFQVARKLDKLGWHSSDTAELVLDNVEVQEDCILGKVGQGWTQASSNLNWERLMLSLISLAGARACLKESVLYSKQRTAFGKPISQHGLIRDILIEMYRRIVMAEGLAHHTLDLLCQATECKAAKCRAEISALKRIICEEAIWIADKTIQIHGGYGYTTEFNAERWWRDLRLMPIGGGTTEIMGEIIAKELAL